MHGRAVKQRRADRARIYLLVAALAALAALAPLAFWLGGVLAGLIIIISVLALVAFVATRWERSGDVEVLADPDDVHRILIVAHGDADGDELVRTLQARKRPGETEVRIVVPALTKPIKRIADDVDDEARAAERSVERMVDRCRASHPAVSGTVGDANPRLAVEDELRVFAANELLVFPPPEDELGEFRIPAPEETVAGIRLPVTVVESHAP